MNLQTLSEIASNRTKFYEDILEATNNNNNYFIGLCNVAVNLSTTLEEAIIAGALDENQIGFPLFFSRLSIALPWNDIEKEIDYCEKAIKNIDSNIVINGYEQYGKEKLKGMIHEYLFQIELLDCFLNQK